MCECLEICEKSCAESKLLSNIVLKITFYTSQDSTATIYIPVGEVGKFIIFQCHVSSGCCTQKNYKNRLIFSRSYSKIKRKLGLTFLRHMVCLYVLFIKDENAVL